MNLRFAILSAISKSPGAPAQEICDAIQYDALSPGMIDSNKIRVGLVDCVKGCLVNRNRDDVTGQPGYTLTEAGKHRLAKGPGKLTGYVRGTNPKQPQPAVGNNTGSGAPAPSPQEGAAVQPKPAPSAEPSSAPVAADVTDLKTRALAARLERAELDLVDVHDQLAGRVCGDLDPADLSVVEIAESAAKMIDSQAMEINNLTAGLRNERALTDKLKHLLDSARHELEHLRRATHNQPGAAQPIGYLVRNALPLRDDSTNASNDEDDDQLFATVEEAQSAAAQGIERGRWEEAQILSIVPSMIARRAIKFEPAMIAVGM